MGILPVVWPGQGEGQQPFHSSRARALNSRCTLESPGEILKHIDAQGPTSRNSDLEPGIRPRHLVL